MTGADDAAPPPGKGDAAQKTSTLPGYDSIILGCGVSGTAAVEAIARRARRGHRCLVLDSDPFALKRCRAVRGEGVDCVLARASQLDPARRRVETTDGEAFTYRPVRKSKRATPPPRRICRGDESRRRRGVDSAAAAAATRMVRGEQSRRRRGRDADSPRRTVAATPRPRRG